nr:hypothetical protein [Tanacetum cinerariifolium]
FANVFDHYLSLLLKKPADDPVNEDAANLLLIDRWTMGLLQRRFRIRTLAIMMIVQVKIMKSSKMGHQEDDYKKSISSSKDYGHIKWIEYLVPGTMWIEEPIGYDKHTLWGVSHWGRKCQQFYGFVVNWESAHVVYSKRRIIVVTKLKIVEWHNYKHLDWITVAMTEAQQLKLVTRRSMQQTYISQPSVSGADEGTGSKPGVPDVPTDESKEELSWNSTDDEGADDEEKVGNDDEEDEGEDGEEGEEDDDEETRDDESFDPIPQTPESNKDEGNGAEDQGLNIGKEERLNEEEEADELYRDVDINQGRGIQVTQEVKDSHVTLTPTDQLRDASQREHDEFLQTVDKNMKKIIKEQVKDQVKEQVSRILPRIKQSVNAQLKAEVLTRSSYSSRTFDAVAADLYEMELKKILIKKIEGNKSIQRSDEQRNLYKALVEAYEADKIILDTYGETVTLKRRRDDDDADKDEGPSAGPDRGSKRRREGQEPESTSAPSETPTRSAGRSTTRSRSRQASASEYAFAEEPVQTTSQMEEPSHPEFDTAVHRSTQPWISELAKQADTRSFFNELMDTPLDFTKFIMNRLRVDTLTPKLLARPTYDLMKGSCKSLIELEYHLEEVYKATTDQLDWVNSEGQQYPHNLLQPLLLIPDNQGRRVIPFAHFINNGLEYLRGGASSRKYTTLVTKTKAADYGYIKWIKDLVPRTMWIQEPIDYDKHALWGVSHWGRKRQQFYGFTVNWESARDVYSKRRIIAVTNLKIVEWHSYKHLDWIMSNLTVEECFAFNVSLRMFTRSIVIQRRVEDLQLGVESYQKRLNLTKPDTYLSDLKRTLLILIHEDSSTRTRTRKTG